MVITSCNTYIDYYLLFLLPVFKLRRHILLQDLLDFTYCTDSDNSYTLTLWKKK